MQGLNSVVDNFYNDAYSQLVQSVISEHDVNLLEEKRTKFASKKGVSEELAKKRVDRDQQLYLHDKRFFQYWGWCEENFTFIIHV